VTVQTLQEMKRQGQRIVAAVCYEQQMAQIMERAGADVLSVGDSVSRSFLAMENDEDFTVDHQILFCRAVSKVAKRALVNCDIPLSAVNGGPKTAAEAARRVVGEAGAEMVKIDIREDMEGLYPVVLEVIKTGIPVYPQIGFVNWWERNGGDEVRDRIVAKAKTLEGDGAVMIDLTAVTNEVYADACKAVRIPVIGGQTGPEADGHIYVSYMLVGYQATMLDKDGDGPNAAKYVYDVAEKAFSNVRAGTF
jgi:3-methyl-2-oxobutanoate hydroxymethyltransferase